MPVCIAGMHRSGTSLVARALHECGLYLGPSEDLLPANTDNREGFWESRRFVELNDELLRAVGGTWDAPPEPPENWEQAKGAADLRRRASALVEEFAEQEPWGWKDPRSSLTIRFWQRMVPDLKVVQCVRNPVEVAKSLERRSGKGGNSLLDLWLAYNRELSASVSSEDLIVTHYDSFFADGEAEMRRLTAFLGLETTELMLAHAATVVNESVRHHKTPARAGAANGLPSAVTACYSELCAASGRAALGADRESSKPERRAPLRKDSRALVQQGHQYTDYDDSPGSTHNLIVGLVPERAHVLEFGCATGYMSAVLKERLGAVVTGIELSPGAAEAAREHCERVVVGDAEMLDYEKLFPRERFDVVLFADILEHLKDPTTLLRTARDLLTKEGTVVASVPNVAHGSVRLALLGGEFRYTELGLLDRTHLQFFTRERVQDLFEEAGYVVTALVRRRVPIEESEVTIPGTISAAARAAVAEDPEATTYQFVVTAAPTDAASQLHALRHRLRTTRDELEELRPAPEELARRTEELATAREELERVRQAHLAVRRRIVAERAAFANHVQEFDSLREDESVSTVENEEIERLRDELQHANQELARHAAVVENQRRELQTVLSSRSFRYTAPLRRAVGVFRRSRSR